MSRAKPVGERAYAERNSIFIRGGERKPDAAAKHTPGPWTYRKSPTSVRYIQTRFDGYIANVNSQEDGIDNPTRNLECDANASLIAAAPDLLSALVALEQAYSNKHSPQHRAACLNEARAAIAKASGQ